MTKIYNLTQAEPSPTNKAKVDRDPSVTVVGTFGTGVVNLYQDVDGTEVVLPNAASPLAITAVGIYPINVGNGARIVPRVATPDGTTNLLVEVNGTTF